jgi:hypothetical protein
MLTGLTPDDDIPELRLTAPELPEAVEGFYRRALNERPEARFRSVRELYEEFVALLAPAGTQGAVPSAPAEQQPTVAPEVSPSDAQALVEELEPIPDGAPVAAEAPVDAAPTDVPTPAAPPASIPEPIAAAALPRLEGHAVEAPRHTREVVALDPPEWTGASAPPADLATSQSDNERWQSLRLWDAESDAEGRPGTPSAAEATGPELPVSTQPGLALVRSAAPAGSVLDASEEEAELAVAGLTEIEDGPVGALEEDGADEPLLAEALGVDLVVDGDEPVPEPVNPAPDSLEARPTPLTAVPTPVPLAEDAQPAVAEAPLPSPVRDGPRLLSDSRPWNLEPAPPLYRRESPDRPRETRETPAVHPRPVPVVPAASLGEAPSVAARSVLPPAPSIPPLSSPRLSSMEANASAPTPVAIVLEPSPTRQERVIAPPPPLEALAAPVAPARGAGSWSPAELLAQVIAEIQSEERGAGLPQTTSWEPVPLDATQPISTDEVAARLAAEDLGPATGTIAAAHDEDLPAMRHEAGRAAMRMALLTAAGLIMGILGGWTAMKLYSKPPRPQAERISEVRPSQSPAPR